jgi:hypothetical protein
MSNYPRSRRVSETSGLTKSDELAQVGIPTPDEGPAALKRTPQVALWYNELVGAITYTEKLVVMLEDKLKPVLSARNTTEDKKDVEPPANLCGLASALKCETNRLRLLNAKLDEIRSQVEI